MICRMFGYQDATSLTTSEGTSVESDTGQQVGSFSPSVK